MTVDNGTQLSSPAQSHCQPFFLMSLWSTHMTSTFTICRFDFGQMMWVFAGFRSSRFTLNHATTSATRWKSREVSDEAESTGTVKYTWVSSACRRRTPRTCSPTSIASNFFHSLWDFTKTFRRCRNLFFFSMPSSNFSTTRRNFLSHFFICCFFSLQSSKSVFLQVTP